MNAEERIEQAYDAASRFMAAHEAVDVVELTRVWDAADREALVTVLAGWLVRVESRLENAERVLHMTRDVRPAGLSRAQAWNVAVESEERKSA